jgi:hypothetical protein
MTAPASSPSLAGPYSMRGTRTTLNRIEDLAESAPAAADPLMN